MPNTINRNFHAEKPNEKWLTDITGFAIPVGKVYLSPIVDCFGGMLPYWTVSTAPDAALVNDMLFGCLKNEMFYNRGWAGVSIQEFIDILNEYLVWYTEKRIKISLGNMSPLEYRRSLGLAA